MKRCNLLLPCLLFLTECSFNGIMSESYNGEKITADQEAVKLFEEENLLDTEGLDARYAFLNSDTEFTGIGDSGTEITLQPGQYITGEDIGAGRYMASTANASAIVVYDEEGERLLEAALNDFNTEVVLELQPGFRVDYVTRQGSITLTPLTEQFETAVPAGIHTVGKNFEAGIYTLYTEELPVRRADSEDEVYMNSAGIKGLGISDADFELKPESGIRVILNEGDTIVSEHRIILEKN